MTAKEVYQHKIDTFEQQVILLQKKEQKSLTIGRLLSFFGAIAVFYILFPFNLTAAVLAALLCLVYFGFQIVWDRKKPRENCLLSDFVENKPGRAKCFG